MSHLEQAYFIHRVKRTDIEGKKHFEIGEKIYFDDLGLRNSIIGYKASDISKIMENAVFIHLITAGWHVTVGYSNHTEIDFIATKGGDKMYVQVCYLLQSEETIQREFGNLLSIPDNFRKLVVSLDDLMPGSTYKGIEQVHLKDFLQ